MDEDEKKKTEALCNYNLMVFEAYMEHHVQPSTEWLDELETLTDEDFNNFKDKKKQVEEIKLQRELIPSIRIMSNVGVSAENRASMEKFFGVRVEEVNYSTVVSDLNEILASGRFIPKRIKDKLGVQVVYKTIKKIEQHHIKWMAAAQVVWQNRPRFLLGQVVDEIRRFDPKLSKSLGLDKIKKDSDRSRGLREVIRIVEPGRDEHIRGCPVKVSFEASRKSVMIPGVYYPESNGINFRALFFVIKAISWVLFYHENYSEARILAHPILLKYKSLVSSSMQYIVDMWVKESISK